MPSVPPLLRRLRERTKRWRNQVTQDGGLLPYLIMTLVVTMVTPRRWVLAAIIWLMVHVVPRSDPPTQPR